jgi:hypothetical protein
MWIIGCVLAFSACGPHGHPSDASCIAAFKKHEAQFERLRTLIGAEEETDEVSAEFATAALKRDDSHREKWEEYLTLLSAVDLPNGGIRLEQSPLRIKFELSHAGTLRGTYKYLVYDETEPSPLEPQLDRPAEFQQRWHVAYRRIDGNWYLMLVL